MWSDQRYFCRQLLTLDVPVLANYIDYYTAGRAIFEPDNNLGTLCAPSSRTLLMSWTHLAPCCLHDLLVTYPYVSCSVRRFYACHQRPIFPIWGFTFQKFKFSTKAGGIVLVKLRLVFPWD